MIVRHVMDPDPPILSADRSLRESIRLLLVEEIGYAIVVDSDGNPGGIITESDVLHAVYQADPPPEEIRVLSVAHAPDFTVEPTLPVRKTVRQMTKRDQTVAPVMDGLELVGVVSLEGIMEHPAITVQERGLEEGREQWDST